MEAIPERIGPYQVVREVGRGGMGVVYLGHDEKLDRPVAIKALAEDFADDPERLARFEREARVLASLSHGNIATVYGLEDADGQRFLVMEFVEGQTLADRLADGPLPVNEALAVTAQIAAGVEAAHEAGVVHRDLKPGNVIVRPDGTPKVLDFGLARELPARSSRTGLEDAATAPPRSFTREGVSIGTPGYMSPEQVRGMTVDRRTDVFAFGAILYECLAGQLAFGGQTAHDSVAAILEREPDWSPLPPNTPPTVQLLLRRLLQKDRRRRLRDIGDARIELEQAIEDPTSTSLGLAGAALVASRTTRAGSRVPWLVTALFAVVACIAMWLAFRPAVEVARPISRFMVTLPEGLGIRPDFNFRSIDLSRDGRSLVLLGTGDPWTDLYVRPLDQLEPMLLPNTSDATGPVFSPDGAWVAFTRAGEIQRISVSGGPPSTVCKVGQNSTRGLVWSPDGHIIYGTNSGGLQRVLAVGGAPAPLTTVEEDADLSHRQPALLPDGRGVLFASFGPDDVYGTVMVTTDELEAPKELVAGGKAPCYVPSGHLVFYREGTIMAAPFDLDRLELAGPAVPVVENVAATRDRAGAQFSVSPAGTLAYLLGSTTENNQIVWLDERGIEEPISERPMVFRGLSLSPDGSQAAIVRSADESDTQPFGPGELWVLDIERDVPRRLTRGRHDVEPAWHPGGQWIAFCSNRHDGAMNLYRIRLGASSEPERLTTSDASQTDATWTPDGRTLVFNEGGDIMLLRFDEAGEVVGEVEPLMKSADSREWRPCVSPDGVWVAYLSDEAGAGSLYVRPLEGDAIPVRVTTDATWAPVWSPTEAVLYFSGPTGLFAVDYEVRDGVFRPSDPRQLNETGPEGISHFITGYDPHRQSFLAITLPGFTLDDPRVTFVLNWFTELEAKAGVRK
jgi:serine/threonine-protein kinase